jgi:predicted nucleic acid-binding Zn ribbon protein
VYCQRQTAGFGTNLKNFHFINKIKGGSMLLQDTKIQCRFCNKLIFPHNVSRHESACHLNPANIKECVVCSKPIKNWKTGYTCSNACSNKHFRSGENNGNWKQDAYRTTCFAKHEKKCVVCGEQNIVEVHHLDHNDKNNDPSNLIPLCPTHHQYWHSKFKYLIENKVRDYILNWQRNQP